MRSFKNEYFYPFVSIPLLLYVFAWYGFNPVLVLAFVSAGVVLATLEERHIVRSVKSIGEWCPRYWQTIGQLVLPVLLVAGYVGIGLLAIVENASWLLSLVTPLVLPVALAFLAYLATMGLLVWSWEIDNQSMLLSEGIIKNRVYATPRNR